MARIVRLSASRDVVGVRAANQARIGALHQLREDARDRPPEVSLPIRRRGSTTPRATRADSFASRRVRRRIVRLTSSESVGIAPPEVEKPRRACNRARSV